MKKNIFSTVICIMLISSTYLIHGQNSQERILKTWEMKEYAKNAEQTNNYVVAYDFYKKLHVRKPKNKKIEYKYAFYAYKTRNYSVAKRIFKTIYAQKGYKYIESLYYYADICKINKEYALAEQCYSEICENAKTKNHKLLKYYSELAIEGLKFINDTIYQKDIYIQHLNSTINKPHLESSPIIISDSAFIYSSYDIDTIEIISKISETCPVSSFYLAKMENGIWKGGKPTKEPFFNIPLHCTANGAFSDDKTRFYFTAKTLNEFGKPITNIYFTELKAGKWTSPIKLGNNINSNYSNSTQPTVGNSYNKNLEVIYFVSNRPGGWGGKDIWITVYDKIHKTFTEPVNAGGYINTIGDEMTPFYDNRNKIMYFSSNGLASFGGFDVYKAVGEAVQWTEAVNVGSPINTPYDEFYFSKFNNQQKGFFISNRPEALDWGVESCCFDIFSYDVNKPEVVKITGQVKAPEKTIRNEIDSLFHVKHDENSNNFETYISNAIINLNIKNNNDSTYFKLFSDTTDVNGNFEFTIEKNQDYEVTLNADGYLFSTCEFTTRGVQENAIEVGCLKVEPETENNIVLDNVLFEFNSSELTKESIIYIETEIVPVLIKFPNIIVEIGAHTDYKGSSDYNLKLSQARAQSVVDCIVEHGVKENRIIAKGYGETKHLVNERNPDGSDNPEARRLNRRVEFKIVGFIQE